MTGDSQIPEITGLKPGINPDDLVPLRKPGVPRFLLILAMIGGCSVLLLGLGFVILLSSHISATSILRLSGFQVRWDIDELNWRSGGTTRVSGYYRYNLFQARRIGVEDLTQMARLINLTDVDLSGVQGVNDDTLVMLTKLGKLRRLDLSSVRSQPDNSKFGPVITDAGVLKIAQIIGLTELYLVASGITDQGLKTLSTMKSLEILDLSDTKITDAGIAELKNLTNLKSLILEATEVSNKAVIELKVALPGLSSVSVSGPNSDGSRLPQ